MAVAAEADVASATIKSSGETAPWTAPIGQVRSWVEVGGVHGFWHTIFLCGARVGFPQFPDFWRVAY